VNSRNTSGEPLNRSWSPTVSPDDVYCHIVYADHPAGNAPTDEAYRATHNGFVEPKPR
jgi:hypothetical protein